MTPSQERKAYKLQMPLFHMPIMLTSEEKQELARQTECDPQVVFSFYEWFGRFREQHDESTACRLALGKKQEVFEQVYTAKLALYLKEVSHDYGLRVRNLRRLRPGPRFKTKSGIRVRSKIEKIIADFLYEQRLRFVYEPIVGLGGFYVSPDFYLPDFELFLEHFGRDDAQYEQATEAKLARYKQFKIRLVCTYAAEEPDIEEALSRKLREAGVPLPGESLAGSVALPPNSCPVSRPSA